MAEQLWANLVGNGNTLVLRPNMPIKERADDNTWVLTYEYWTLKKGAEGRIPAIDSAPDDPAHPTLELRTARILPNREGSPLHCDITLIFRDPTSQTNFSSNKDGDIVKESRAAFLEKPVTDSNLGFSQADLDALAAENVRTVSAFTLTYNRTEYVTSFVFSEANMIENVGKVEGPNGVSSPTLGAWLKTEKAVTKSGDSLISIREAWQFDENLWDLRIYDEA